MQHANLAGQGMVPGMGQMYPYNMYMPQQQQQAAGGGQRRGRVSRNASPASSRR
jgi:protein JSN1